MKKIFDLKTNFLLLYDISVWIFGLISPLVFFPAVFSRHFNETVIKGISVLLITSIVAVYMVFLPRRKSLVLSKRYIISGFVALLMGIFSLLYYMYFDDRYTVEHPAGSGNFIITAEELKPQVINDLRADSTIVIKSISAFTLLDEYSSDPYDIWFKDDIQRNSYVLLGLYFLTLFFFITFIITTAYGLYFRKSGS